MEFSLEKVSRLQMGAAAVCAGFAGFALVKILSKPKHSMPLPPGPPGGLILGNMSQYPASDPYTKFAEWARTYGDLVYVRLPGMSMVFVNKIELIRELLDKRASNNSARTIGYMWGELMDWKWLIAFRQPSKDFQEMRKMLKPGVGPQVLGSYDNLVADGLKELVVNLNGFRGDPTEMVKRTIGRIIVQMGYGEKIWDEIGDELVELNTEGFNILTDNVTQFWIVDYIRVLRFVPSWMPGAKFKRVVNRSRELSHRTRTWPWERLLELHKSGTAGHSLGTKLIDEYGPTDNVRDVIGALYHGGFDTTTNSVVVFLLTMFLFPEVARKVHAEIEKQVGKERLPVVSDRSALPYTLAAWKESMRWKPWIPEGVAHTSQSDQFINGYFIPKGTMIRPNIGFIFSDRSIWGDPEVFRPERFLPQYNPNAHDLPDPSQLIFGFGTRICPGIHFANRFTFHMAATIMSLFELLPPEGRLVPDPDTVEFSDSSVKHPLGFDCRFVPRGPAARNLVLSIEMESKH